MGESSDQTTVKQEATGKSTPRKRSNAADNGDSGSPQKKAKGNPDGERKTGAWSKAEDKLLFEQVWQKATGVNWNQVSDRIEGRDYLVSLAVVSVVALQYHSEEIATLPFTKSCRNRSKQLAKNLEKFFAE